MPSKHKSAQAIAISSVAAKLPEETQVPQAAKVPEGPKTTVVSAKVTKSIMAKAVGAKMRESPRDDEHGHVSESITERSAIADASLAPCDLLTATDKLPVPTDTSATTAVLSATAIDYQSLANHVSSEKVGKINIEM